MLVHSGKNIDGNTVIFDTKTGTIDPGMTSCFSDIYVAALCDDGYYRDLELGCILIEDPQ